MVDPINIPVAIGKLVLVSAVYYFVIRKAVPKSAKELFLVSLIFWLFGTVTYSAGQVLESLPLAVVGGIPRLLAIPVAGIGLVMFFVSVFRQRSHNDVE